MRDAFTKVAILAILASGTSNGQTEPELHLTVRVYDSARVGAADLHRAEKRADIIFREAKIRVTWVLVPLASEVHAHHDSAESNPADLHLKFWPRAAVGPNTSSQRTLGFRVSTETSTAVILADEVRNRALPQFTDPAELLGLVMAHEMGHLLLPSTTHSVEGIMRDRLLTDLRDPGRTALVFTRKQAASMQNEVRRRMGLGAQSREPGMQIEVHIYNYSALSAEMVARAELETARIFERIGVATIWVVCPRSSQEGVRNEACALPDTLTRLTLRLFSNSLASRVRLGGDVFGYALLPADEGFGLVANVYANRIRELPNGGECAGVIFGRIIAHELGHLLLGKNGHSAAGIMHTPWRSEDLELHREGLMLFMPGEAKRIRAQVLARMSKRQHPITPLCIVQSWEVPFRFSAWERGS